MLQLIFNFYITLRQLDQAEQVFKLQTLQLILAYKLGRTEMLANYQFSILGLTFVRPN
jgi:hypothetical protein